MRSSSSESLSIFETFRLGLINVTVGMSAILVFGVLNRVMISEWQLSATLVGVLVFAHFVVCPIRTLAGYASDTRPLWGWKRTPYIAGGMTVTLGSILLILHSAQLMRTHLVLGAAASIASFALWGIGINTASVSYLALMTDLSGKNKARTVSIAWFMMVAFGIVATGICISVFFKLNLSKMSADVTTMDLATLDGVLFKLFYAVVGISAVLVALALVGMEPRNIERKRSEESDLTFRETLAVVTGSRESKLFFGVVFLGIFGVNAQDILMEPYGAQVLNMSLAETTKLQPAWGGATLVTMLLAGLVAARFMSRKKITLCGAVLCTLGLGVMIAAGTGSVPVLKIGVILLGAGNGLFAVGALSLMMEMTQPGQAATFLGVWGIAQALAQGLAGLVAGFGRSGIERLTGDTRLAYQGVFALEIATLIGSIVLLMMMGGTTPRPVRKTDETMNRFADIVSAN